MTWPADSVMAKSISSRVKTKQSALIWGIKFQALGHFQFLEMEKVVSAETSQHLLVCNNFIFN